MNEQKSTRGAGMVEYVILVFLIALTVVASVLTFRQNVQDRYTQAEFKVSGLR